MSVSHSESTNSSSSSSSPVIPASNLEQQKLMESLFSYWGSIESGVFDWAQGAYNGLVDLTDPVIQNQIRNAQSMSNASEQQLDRYNKVFQPQENALVADANSYSSEARKEQEMGAASARAQQANQAARQQSLSNLESMGVDPSSGRYAALDQASNLQGAAIAVGAANQARVNTESVGRSLRDRAVQVGQQMPNQVANYNMVSQQGNSSAANIGDARTGLGSSMLNQPGQVASGLLGSLHYPSMGTQSSSSSSGSSTSDSSAPNPAPVAQHASFEPHIPSSYHEVGSSDEYVAGGQVGQLDRRGGGHVPINASPSQGQQTDDIPARLNADEFVIPRDVVHHFGSKHFERLIQQSRKLRGAAQQPIGPTFKRAG